MDSVDDSAARNLQLVYEKLQTGPWNTGVLGGKGSTVTEPLDTSNPSNQDNVSRYTDRYLRHRQVGRTVKDFPFNSGFLPSELHKIVRLSSEEQQTSSISKHSNRTKLVQRIADMADDEEDSADKEDDPENEDNDNEEEVEDEFEEMDDDDYNAEKYFDDGDDYGDADDGDNEAAY